MALLKDLVAAGIRPSVMLLRWSSAGNHFRAVRYLESEHDNYAKNIATYATVRNRLLMEHEWKSMDCVDYDTAKTAKAAAAALLSIRSQVHQRPATEPLAEREAVSTRTEVTMKEAGRTSEVITIWTRRFGEDGDGKQEISGGDSEAARGDEHTTLRETPHSVAEEDGRSSATRVPTLTDERQTPRALTATRREDGEAKAGERTQDDRVEHDDTTQRTRRRKSG
jgi:hypothetical protein